MNTATPQVTVSVQFFASLRETLGCAQITLSLPDQLPLCDFIGLVAEGLAERLGQDHAAQDIRARLEAPNVRVAHNQTVLGAPQLVLQSGDQLAFLPPVTGG